VGSDTPLFELVTELHPQEGTRRIAGDALVESSGVLHHFYVFVQQVRRDVEIVIVSDSVNLFADWFQYLPHYCLHPLNFFTGFHVVVFEIDEEDVICRVVNETILHGDAQEVVFDAHRGEPEYS